MTTLEKNKIIAEFMDFKQQLNPNERWFEQWFATPNGVWGSRIEIFHFNLSWNWLMPVIDKLKSVTEEPEELDVLRDVLWWGSIENVFDSVVDNIIDYNKANKN